MLLVNTVCTRPFSDSRSPPDNSQTGALQIHAAPYLQSLALGLGIALLMSGLCTGGCSSRYCSWRRRKSR
jgi:hypothetical protein